MNVCILSGRIVKNASVRGSETKALSFVVETINAIKGSDKKDFVSAVIFHPTKELEKKLTTEGEGLFCELEGRVSSSASKSNGESRFSTDVIVRHWTFTVIDPREHAPT